MNNIEKEIREHWFREHVATQTQHGDLSVLTRKKPGTSFYYVRYVFDNNKMYVSGDTGEAVFVFTEKADVHTIADYSLGYFESKLAACVDARRDFNSQKAIERIREEFRHTKVDWSKVNELIEAANDCTMVSHWEHHLSKFEDLLYTLDEQWYEWLPGAGNMIPRRIKGYLIGLKMASEQLKSSRDRETF